MPNFIRIDDSGFDMFSCKHKKMFTLPQKHIDQRWLVEINQHAYYQNYRYVIKKTICSYQDQFLKIKLN